MHRSQYSYTSSALCSLQLIQTMHGVFIWQKHLENEYSPQQKRLHNYMYAVPSYYSCTCEVSFLNLEDRNFNQLCYCTVESMPQTSGDHAFSLYELTDV